MTKIKKEDNLLSEPEDTPVEEPSDTLEGETSEEELSGEESSEETESEMEEDSNEQQSIDEEELFEIQGEQISLEELKKGYMRQQDYSKKTEEVKSMRKQLEEAVISKQAEKNDDLSDSEKQALAALDKLGVAKKADIETVVRRIFAQQNIMSERQRVQQETGLEDAMIDAAQVLSVRKGISLSEAAKMLTGTTTKVIKRKSVGTKSGISTSSSSTQSGKITPETIRKMDPNSKEFEKVVEMMEKGEL